MSDDPNLEAMGRILTIISSANDLAAALEKLMNEHPSEAYSIPTENLLGIVSILKLNAQLATNLFEENQNINDQLQTLLKNLSK